MTFVAVKAALFKIARLRPVLFENARMQEPGSLHSPAEPQG